MSPAQPISYSQKGITNLPAHSNGFFRECSIKCRELDEQTNVTVAFSDQAIRRRDIATEGSGWNCRDGDLIVIGGRFPRGHPVVEGKIESSYAVGIDWGQAGVSALQRLLQAEGLVVGSDPHTGRENPRRIIQCFCGVIYKDCSHVSLVR